MQTTDTTAPKTRTIKAVAHGKTLAKRTVGAHKFPLYRWAFIAISTKSEVRFLSCRSDSGRAALVKRAVEREAYWRHPSNAAQPVLWHFLVLPIVDGTVTIPFCEGATTNA